MRVITGKYRKQKIIRPSELTTRPMMDYVKQSLFNALHNRVSLQGSVVLDLFAGSGQLGLETLSQGAKFCWFNDKDAAVHKVLEHNLRHVPKQNYKLSQHDFMEVLKNCANQKQAFNLIFLDPPFAKHSFYDTALKFVVQNQLLRPKGIVALESEHLIDFAAYDLEVLFAKHAKQKYWALLWLKNG